MSHRFKDHELEVLGKLLSRHYTHGELKELLKHAQPGKTDYTGYGFFVTARSPAIGSDRKVCFDPLIVGESVGRTANFVAFLEGGELTLETFPADGESLPANFRDGEVHILSTAGDLKTNE